MVLTTTSHEYSPQPLLWVPTKTLIMYNPHEYCPTTYFKGVPHKECHGYTPQPIQWLLPTTLYHGYSSPYNVMDIPLTYVIKTAYKTISWVPPTHVMYSPNNLFHGYSLQPKSWILPIKLCHGYFPTTYVIFTH